jgi:hypothetical protein
MKLTARQLTAYALGLLIIMGTTVALLSIWDIIDIENVMARIMKSLVVIFAASVISLFVFNVLFKENK